MFTFVLASALGSAARMAARLDTAAARYAAAPEDTFEFGLRILLDGMEAQLGNGGYCPDGV
jgi:hypothetical protein